MIPSATYSVEQINTLAAQLGRLKIREQSYLSQLETLSSKMRDNIGLTADLLSCKLKIIQNLTVTPPESRDFVATQLLFQKKLEELKQENLISYQSLLQQRTTYLKKGEERPLTPEKKEKWLAAFKTGLDQKIQEQTLPLDASVHLESLKAELETRLNTQLTLYHQTLEEKDQISHQLKTTQETYQTQKATQRQLLKAPPLNLWTASENGNLTYLRSQVQSWWFWQVEAQINVKNAAGCTPFLLACAHGQLETVHYLLRHSAHPDIPDSNGYQPLHWAAKKGELEIVKILLEQRVNVNATAEYQRTPLHMAAHNGHPSIVTLLLKAGAHPHLVTAKEDTCITPCHEAVMKGDLPVLQALTACPHLDVNVKDGQGQTPLYYAVSLGLLEIVSLLLHHPSWKNPSDSLDPNHTQQLLKLTSAHSRPHIKKCLEDFS